MKVLAKATGYYKDRIRKEGSVFDFDENDMDRGKDGSVLPTMPKWVIVAGSSAANIPLPNIPLPNTLHEMTKTIPKVSTPAFRAISRSAAISSTGGNTAAKIQLRQDV